MKQPDRTDIGATLSKSDRRFLGYYNIARHYKWALNEVFLRLNHSAAIIIEGTASIIHLIVILLRHFLCETCFNGELPNVVLLINFRTTFYIEHCRLFHVTILIFSKSK